jgi:hypothetical protein
MIASPENRVVTAAAVIAVLAEACAFGAHELGFVVQVPGAWQDSLAGSCLPS